MDGDFPGHHQYTSVCRACAPFGSTPVRGGMEELPSGSIRPSFQFSSSLGHREEQRHQVTLGASREGHLTAFRHHKLSPTSHFDDWAEPSLGMSSQLYDCPNYEGIYRLIHTNTMTPTFMRGPGETTGVFALECAMDELAYKIGIDPLELRLRNYADVDPCTGYLGHPFVK
jgi:xanthine dehydrogenase YagR molybdenum-binding subunit